MKQGRSALSAQRLISIDPPRSGAENMDIDSRDLQRVETSLENLTIIRLYQWSSPTVSLGKNQLAE